MRESICDLFARRLREVIAEKNISVEEVGRLLSMSERQISALLAGKGRITVRMIQHIAETLQVPMNRLLE